MDLQQIIDQHGGLASIAGELGMTEQQAGSGIQALLPAILGGFARNAQGGESAIGALVETVESAGGGGLLANVLGNQPTRTDAGNAIVAQIFGSQGTSQTVVDHVAGTSGIDAGMLRKLLPVVAMLAAGYMSHSSSDASGGLAGVIGNLVGGGETSGGGFGGLLGSLLGGGNSAASATSTGALGALLDQNGDGSSLDDILSFAGKFMSR